MARGRQRSPLTAALPGVMPPVEDTGAEWLARLEERYEGYEAQIDAALADAVRRREIPDDARMPARWIAVRGGALAEDPARDASDLEAIVRAACASRDPEVQAEGVRLAARAASHQRRHIVYLERKARSEDRRMRIDPTLLDDARAKARLLSDIAHDVESQRRAGARFRATCGFRSADRNAIADAVFVEALRAGAIAGARAIAESWAPNASLEDDERARLCTDDPMEWSRRVRLARADAALGRESTDDLFRFTQRSVAGRLRALEAPFAHGDTAAARIASRLIDDRRPAMALEPCTSWEQMQLTAHAFMREPLRFSMAGYRVRRADTASRFAEIFTTAPAMAEFLDWYAESHGERASSVIWQHGDTFHLRVNLTGQVQGRPLACSFLHALPPEIAGSRSATEAYCLDHGLPADPAAKTYPSSFSMLERSGGIAALHGDVKVVGEGVPSLLGDGHCTHGSARWVPATTTLTGTERTIGMRRACPMCLRTRLSFVPAHRLAGHDIPPEDEADYLRLMALRDLLAGRPSCDSLAALRARDGIADLETMGTDGARPGSAERQLLTRRTARR